MKKLTRKFFRNRKSAFRFGKHPLSRFSMESLFSNMSDSMVPIDSLTSPDYTWSWSKISCLRSMYFAHVFWCYIVFLAGIGCMLTRLWQGPPAWRLHSWFGYWYIISMLWATATSMLIHNTGLPPAVLVSFIWCLGGLTIGWFLIRLHMAKMDAAAFEVVKEEIMSGKASDVSLPAALAKHKAEIMANKNFAQRFFSYRMLHASAMITSWINIAGRIFASNQSGDFTCHTIPANKPISTPHGDFRQTTLTGLTAVSPIDPDYARLPWARTGLFAWGAILLVAPALIAAAIYACCICCAIKRKKNPLPKVDSTPASSEL